MGLKGERVRALVTGGTGFLGAHLVRSLMAQGDSVRVLTRSHPKGRTLTEQGVEVVIGDITDRAALKLAIEGVDVVYHLAGKLYVQGVPEREYESAHVEGTRAVLAVSGEIANLSRFVHVSTTGVLGPTGDQPANEDRSAAPSNIYERTKWQAELLVREAIEKGFPAVIVRPGLVYGPGDMHLLGFFRAIQRGFFRPIGSKPIWLHPIYVADHTKALLSSAYSQQALGECFHIAGAEPVTVSEFAAAIAVALGKRPPHGYYPLPVARLAAGISGLLPAGMQAWAPLTRSRVDFLSHNRVYDVSKARNLLGFSADTALAFGLAKTASWYWHQGYLPAHGNSAVKQALA